MGHSPKRRGRLAGPLFELKLSLKPARSREAAKVLHQELTAAIVDGRLAAGTQLPPTRRSSGFFGVSRNTAAEVYERLVSEGHAETRRGAGTFVAERLAARPAAAPPSSEETHKRRLNAFWLREDITAAMSFWRDSTEEPVGRKATPVDFRPAMV